VSILKTIGRSQDGELDRFRAGSAESSLLAELVETHCLLELAKVATGCTDLASYAEHVVAILTQFLPLKGCTVQFEVDGLPPAKASFGHLGAAPSPGPIPLSVAQQVVGVLVVCCAPGQPDRVAFFAMVAEQVSAAAHAIADHDLLRRQAAAATALQLASTLGDDTTDDVLGALAAALAALPTATGATLTVHHAAFGPAATRKAGQSGVRSDTHLLELAGGSVNLEVSWAAEPSRAERDMLATVLSAAAGSLERAEERRRLEADLDTDPLTGVGSRRRATRDLTQAISRAERSHEPVALLYLDLDRFKAVNDTLGHDIGDAVLRAVAQGVARDLRGYDTVARMGGDEFVVICPNLETRGATTLASRLRAAAPDWTAGALPQGWSQTVSIGVAVYPLAADSGPGLISAADVALYDAKQSGRDQVKHADPTC